MRKLHHFPLSPKSRKVRLVLGEKKLDVELIEEKPWERRVDFLSLNPAGDLPVLIEPDGEVLADSQAICEYLDEIVVEPPLIGFDPLARAEARRLVAWFDQKFDAEVTQLLIGEKVLKRLQGQGGPDSRAVRAGFLNIRTHLDYIGWLSERRKWLAGDHFSLADIAAAAHLSCIDYLGDAPWDDHPQAKDWYARVKSRPSFRPLLNDRMSGLVPPAHYADLDF